MAEAKKAGILGRLVKWGLIVGVVLVAVAAAIPFFIDWNAMKDKGTAYLSKTLHHQVSIESVSVSLFTGVQLNKLSVGNAQGYSSQPLFYNERAVLRPSLLSLLVGRVVINEIEFKNPKVLIEKGGKGQFNFSDMAPSTPSTGSGSSAGSDSAPNVIVASFRITGGELVYHDRVAGKTQAVKGLDLALSGFSLKAGGKSRLELKFTAETEGKKIPLQLVSNFSLDLDKQSVHLASLNFTAPGLSLDVNGTVGSFKSDPSLDLQAKAVAKLGEVIEGMLPPSTLAAIPGGLKASGALTLDALIKGRASNLAEMNFKAALGFDKLGVRYGDMPAIEDMQGTLNIAPHEAGLPALKFNMGGSPVTLGLQATDYSLAGLMGPRENLRLNLHYTLSSPKLVLEPVMAYAAIPDTPAELKEKAAENARTGGMADYRPKVSKGLHLSGAIKVGALSYKKILTGPLTHVLEIKDRQMKSTLELKLFEGTIWNELTADLSVPGPRHVFHLIVSKLQFAPAVDAAAASFPEKKFLQQIKGKFFGALSADFKGKGTGSKPPALNKNLVLEGTFGMKDGVLKKLDLQEKLAAAIPHPATQEVLRKDLKFGQMGGKITLKNELMTLSDFYLSSGADHRGGEILVQASGTQKLGGALDYKIIPRFNPRVVKLDGVAADAFNDDQGWASYNYIAYKGPNMDEAKGDYTAGVKNAAKKVLDKQMNQLKDKAAEEAKKQAEDKGKDLIKQLPDNLKGLFGQ